MAGRNPLGAVSASNLNSRQSLGPQRRLSVAQKPANRMSLAASTGVRKSSIGSRPSVARPSIGGAGGRRSTLSAQTNTKASDDPRQIKDASFKNAAIHRVIEYLVSHGYDKPVNPKQLQAPSTKDFLHILLFLYRRIDPNFTFGPKYEEQVPALFKRFKYPFPISKSNISAVGAPHTWPTILAALYWLVELLEYDERVDTNAAPEDLVGDNSEKMFFDYLARSYEAWLTGEDDETLENELSEQFAAKNRAMEEDCATFTEANKRMQEEVQEYSVSPLEAFQEKKMILLTDVDKFNTLIAQLEGHVVGAEKKLTELETESTAKEQEIAAVTAEIADLKHQISLQPLSAHDVQRMGVERQQLAERQNESAAMKQTVQNQLDANERELSKKASEVEHDIHEYRQAAQKMKLIPKTAKHAQGTDYDLPSDTGNDKFVDSLLAVDVKSTLRPTLDGFRESYEKKIRDLFTAKVAEEGRLKLVQEQIVDKQDELQTLQSELDKVEAAFKMEKELREGELKSHAAQSAELEEEALKTKSSIATRLAKAERELQGLNSQFEEMCANFQLEQTQMTDYLMSSLDLIARHKLHIQEKLETLEGTCSKIASEIES